MMYRITLDYRVWVLTSETYGPYNGGSTGMCSEVAYMLTDGMLCVMLCGMLSTQVDF